MAKKMNLDIPDDELPNFIPNGQVAIPKEDYLKMRDEGTLPDTIGWYGVQSVYITPGENPGEDLTEKEDNLRGEIERILSLGNVKFEVRAGHDYTINPFDQDPIIIDDSALAGWFYFNLGIKNWTSEDAVSGVNGLSKTIKLVDITANTTSSDSLNAKLGYLDSAQIGDLLFFDTYTRNSMVGIYTGDGQMITVNEVGINKFPLWTYSSETFDYEEGPMMRFFNGRIRRPEDYDTEGFRWSVHNDINVH